MGPKTLLKINHYLVNQHDQIGCKPLLLPWLESQNKAPIHSYANRGRGRQDFFAQLL